MRKPQKFPFANFAALNPIPMHRDFGSRRTDRTPSRPHVAPDEDLRIESAVDAERFIEDVGFGVRPIFRLFDTIAAQESAPQ